MHENPRAPTVPKAPHAYARAVGKVASRRVERAAPAGATHAAAKRTRRLETAPNGAMTTSHVRSDTSPAASGAHTTGSKLISAISGIRLNLPD